MTAKKRKQKPESAKQMLDRCVTELALLNRRYAGMFEFVHDPQTYAPASFTREVVEVTIERDMKQGETLMVPIPIKVRLGVTR